VISALCFESAGELGISAEMLGRDFKKMPSVVYSENVKRRHSFCDDLVALRDFYHTERQEIEQQESIASLHSNEMKTGNHGYCNKEDPSTNNEKWNATTKLQDVKWGQICASLDDKNMAIRSDRADTLRKAMNILERIPDLSPPVRPKLIRRNSSILNFIAHGTHHYDKHDDKKCDEHHHQELPPVPANVQNISTTYTGMSATLSSCIINSLSKVSVLLSWVPRLKDEPGTKLDIDFPPQGRHHRRAKSSVPAIDNFIPSTSTMISKGGNELNWMRRCNQVKSSSKKTSRIVRSLSPRPSAAYNKNHQFALTDFNNQGTLPKFDSTTMDLPLSQRSHRPECFISDEDERFLNGLIFLAPNKEVEIRNLMETS